MSRAPWAGVQFLGNEPSGELAWQLMAEAGFGTVRSRVVGRDAVPSGWIRGDLDKAQRHGFGRVMVTIWFWRMEKGQPVKDADCSTVPLARYRELIRAAASEFAGEVWAWQIDSEPDRCHQAPWDYGWRLAAAYQEIKAVDPDALVVMGGLAYEDLPHIQQGTRWLDSAMFPVMYGRCRPCMDAAAVHSYAGLWPRWGGLAGKVDAFRWHVGRWGYTGPVWVTEGGDDGPNQGERVVEYLSECHRLGLPLCVVYRADSGEDAFGLIGRGYEDVKQYLGRRP